MHILRRTSLATAWLSAVLLTAALPAPLRGGEDVDLLGVMEAELERSLENLADASEAPLYFLQYAVTEHHTVQLAVKDGGAMQPDESLRRFLDVGVRVGSMALDNTHEIRGGSWRDNYMPRRLVEFPLDADPAAIRAALWNETEYQYRKAQERYTKVLTNRQVMVAEEDQSNDFSPVEPHRYVEPVGHTRLDRSHWQGILNRIGGYLAGAPRVQASSVSLSVTDEATYLASSEGNRLQHGNHYLRLRLQVEGTADDGMSLSRGRTFDAADPGGLPDEETLRAAAERLVAELNALHDAPVVEPYIGPAILRNRASGVFFHEIFGHRIEGHRQKSESEGQTFTKKVGQQILPQFISVYDDPTRRRFGDVDLRGTYRFDDEGVPAQRVTVVDHGILRNFLTSRSPIENFPASNGHGRRQFGHDVVARQGNLIVASEKTVPYSQLRDSLIAECRRQGKPYGLIFDDISGGFTMTGRGGPQAFKVNPLLVYRVYADGRPDEVVRGVDIVGTPLTSFSKILLTGDDPAVFNGTCGAESGRVPVSAVSPSILVSEIEVEKRPKGQEKPPMLAMPSRDEAGPSGDVVFQAMKDELDRSMEALVIEGMPRPYFLSYRIQENHTLAIEARYGALVETDEDRERYLYLDLRVGGPEFDNTGFVGSWTDLVNQRKRVTDAEDYASLRHQIWLHTDAAYKRALGNLARKQAYLQAHPRRKPLADFTSAELQEHLEEPPRLTVDTARWQREVRQAAEILRGYPELQDWKVAYHATGVTRSFVNSENHRHRKGELLDYLHISATAQAPDGQRLTSLLQYAARDEAPPSGTVLAAEIREMADELVAMVAAPALEEYVGPVLFTDFAAAQFLSQLFAGQLTPVRQPLLAEDWMKRRFSEPKLAGRLNRRVFPDFVTITDRPQQREYQGTPLAGYRVVDDEGVPAEPLTLIRKGRLVDLPMTRQPTKKLSGSNGHAISLPNQWTISGVTNLFVESSEPESDLLGRLRELAREFGNEYGLLVTRLDDPAISGQYRWSQQDRPDPELLTAPVGIYRVYVDDGHREPVRGLVFNEVSIRTLRDVAALGEDARAINFRQPSPAMGYRYPVAFVTPPILVEEMELEAATSREPLPLSQRPLARR